MRRLVSRWGTGCGHLKVRLMLWCSLRRSSDSGCEHAVFSFSVVSADKLSYLLQVTDHPGEPCVQGREPARHCWILGGVRAFASISDHTCSCS